MASSLENKENDTLLTNVIPRDRQISNTGHQSLPSDEEDTDPDIDNDTGYEVYNDEPQDTTAKKKKKKKKVKDGKAYHSYTSPSDTNTKPKSQYDHQKKSWVNTTGFKIICCLIWTVLLAGLVIFFYFYFQPKDTTDYEPLEIGIFISIISLTVTYIFKLYTIHTTRYYY